MIETELLGAPPSAHLARSIRVASVPAQHVYVRHIAPEVPPEGGIAVERLLDPDPDDWNSAAGPRWWPPAMLQADWVATHPEFDVLHVQFGFDDRTPDQLRDLVAALRDTGRSLVYTAHDLRNPHHAQRAQHDAQLDVLVPAADALVTLTRGAAAEIRERWGRAATVIPHPHVVDLDTMARLAARPRPPGPFRVGVHVKSRANTAPLPVLRVLADVVGRMPGVVLQVNGHRAVLEPGGERSDPELAEFVSSAASAGAIELHVHDYLDDAALWDYLASLDASVLPYRFGTHSGWLEACRDLGTAVIAPDLGHYRDQGPVYAYIGGEGGVDAASLAGALRAAVADGAPAPLPVAERRRQRAGIAAAHARLYAELVA